MEQFSDDFASYCGLNERDEFETIENCPHEYCTEGYCTACGLETGPKIEFSGGFSDSHIKAKSTSEQSYQREIERVDGLSKELKETVVNKLNQNMKNSRESSRVQNVFCEVYVSGAKKGELKPDNVVRCLHMNGRNLNKSLRVLSGTSPKTVKDEEGEVITMPIVSISPIDCIDDICDKIDKQGKIKAHVDTIRELISKAIDKYPHLLNERPKHVAAGFVKYYCQLHKLLIQDISGLVEISNPTLNQYSTKAKKICEKYKLMESLSTHSLKSG